MDATRGQLGALPGHYLQDSGVEIFLDKERVRIWGTPWTPKFYDWAFMKEDEDLEPIFDRIPVNLDILISHGPPKSVLDVNQGGQHCGSNALWSAIKRTKPKVSIFGHIHEAHGEDEIRWVNGEPTICHNVSLVDASYRPIHAPKEIRL